MPVSIPVSVHHTMPARPESQTPDNLPRLRRGFALRPIIIDRHLFREFAIAFFAVTSFCALLLLIASIFEKLGGILENETPWRQALEYLFAVVPGRLIQAIPIASMLAVLFSLGGLARHNEILAMMTSGIHPLRIAAPILFGGLIIAGLTIATNEWIIPPLEARANYLEARYIEGKEESRITTERNVFARGRGNRFYLMPRYNSRDNIMEKPLIVDQTPNFQNIRRRIEGDQATFVSNHPESKTSIWTFKNYRDWQFDENNRLVSFSQPRGETTVTLEEDLTIILGQRKNPDEMNFNELRSHIGILSERNQNVQSYTTDLIMKLTFPLGVLIVMTIGFSYAVRIRGGSMMQAFGMGVLWAVGYYALAAVMRALGHAGTLPPSLAATLPQILFFVMTIYYLQRSLRWYN